MRPIVMRKAASDLASMACSAKHRRYGDRFEVSTMQDAVSLSIVNAGTYATRLTCASSTMTAFDSSRISTRRSR